MSFVGKGQLLSGFSFVCETNFFFKENLHNVQIGHSAGNNFALEILNDLDHQRSGHGVGYIGWHGTTHHPQNLRFRLVLLLLVEIMNGLDHSTVDTTLMTWVGTAPPAKFEVEVHAAVACCCCCCCCCFM